MVDSSNLKNLYSEAVYAVISNGEEIRFRVGENSQRINDLLEKFNAAAFAFLTAYNPSSKVLPEKENQARQIKLIKILRTENYQFLEGYGTNESESWKREQSLFVIDIDVQKASKIAQKFEQHAILFGEKNKPVKLVWC